MGETKDTRHTHVEVNLVQNVSEWAHQSVDPVHTSEDHWPPPVAYLLSSRFHLSKNYFVIYTSAALWLIARICLVLVCTCDTAFYTDI